MMQAEMAAVRGLGIDVPTPCVVAEQHFSHSRMNRQAGTESCDGRGLRLAAHDADVEVPPHHETQRVLPTGIGSPTADSAWTRQRSAVTVPRLLLEFRWLLRRNMPLSVQVRVRRAA